MTSAWYVSDQLALYDRGEDEIVVFCGTTGDTHLLDANGSAIFLALREASGTLTASEILSRVADPATNVNEDLIPSLEALLQELEQRALVYRVDH